MLLDTNGYSLINTAEFDKVFDSGISKYAKLVWMYCQCLKYQEIVIPDATILSKDLNISKPHVKQALKVLTDKGFIKAGANNG